MTTATHRLISCIVNAARNSEPYDVVLFSEDSLLQLFPEARVTDSTVCGVPFEMLQNFGEVTLRADELRKEGKRVLEAHG